ncbi:ABC transporter, partial [Nocardiopsis tropica]|nr:ABC transporter [Nocardiopsis tropica]
AGETLPYPDGLPDDARAEEFHHRPGAGALAAVPAPDTVLALDLAEQRWDHWELPGVVSVAAVGEGASVLALTEDGVLRSFDPGTGEERARTELLDEVDTEHPPSIRVDTSRAYVNDVRGGLVHEIDYNDDLRVARTFETGVAPQYMVETGR